MIKISRRRQATYLFGVYHGEKSMKVQHFEMIQGIINRMAGNYTTSDKKTH